MSADYFNRICVEPAVGAEQRHLFNLCLGDQDPIKRVTMMKGQFCKAVAMRHADRKQLDKIALHLSLNYFRPLLVELEFADTDLDRNFPIPRYAEIEVVCRIKENFAVSLA